MDKWPEVFSDILSDAKNKILHDPFGDSMINGIISADIKVENPQPYIDTNIGIPMPEVKS